MHVLAEGKMRCLFSLVFGASVILLTSRLDKRGNAADIYYRRNSGWQHSASFMLTCFGWAISSIRTRCAAWCCIRSANCGRSELLTIGGVLLVMTSLAISARDSASGK